jgi:hypothetical protein
MAPDEIATHLETQAEELEFLATECYKCGEIKQAEQCRQSAEETRFLAQQIRNNHGNVIRELHELENLINQCINHDYTREACEILRELIKKFILENISPYSTYFIICGFKYQSY